MSDSGKLTLTPTPLEFLPTVSEAIGAEVWVKREDLTHSLYGGNKIRKLLPTLRAAIESQATDLVTLGAVGSHHVLASALYGKELGLKIHAALVPHPYSERIASTLRATVSTDAFLWSSPNEPVAALQCGFRYTQLLREGRRPVFVAPGGTSLTGVKSYMEAADEVVHQMTKSAASIFDAQFCVLGSGGTVAGLLASHWNTPISKRLIAVRVYPSRLIGKLYLRRLARAPFHGVQPSGTTTSTLFLDNAQLGSGYGHSTQEAEDAKALFATDGIHLETTYTAKAAAALIEFARREGHKKRLLFWNTYCPTLPEPESKKVLNDIPDALWSLMF